jgi:hypothetical protein
MLHPDPARTDHRGSWGDLPDQDSRVGHRLELARRRTFVGRDEQIAAFRKALSDDVVAPLLFLHGAGGTGKTALLHRFAGEATRAGRHVVGPGRFAPGSTATELVAALAPTVDGRDDPVLMIDDFDDWQPLEPWLRERLLPTLPLGTVVVLAGRTPPGLDWTADPGWRELLRVHELRDLPRTDAELLLDRCSVPRESHAQLLALTDGNPLALRVAIDALTDGGSVEEIPLAVAHAVLQRVVGPLPTPVHRRALELCATTETVTERSLDAVGDAAEQFRWLHSLPYVDSGPSGLRLRPFVREAVLAERRWRDPTPDTAPAALPREDFDDAIRAALRSWRRPDLLATNPLTASRLVTRSTEADPVEALRAALKTALYQLGQDARQGKGHRAVLATYLSGAPTQEAAAERLGLPFSTYRRHLAQGLAALHSLLWWQETRSGDRPRPA